MDKAGDSNKITREYFDRILLETRLIDSIIPDTGLELFGEHFSTPVMMAALSHLDSVKGNGMVLMAKGARAAGAVNWAGMGSEEELESIMATGARTVKIIKPYADNDAIFKKIEHAEKCGAFAVGIDIDHAFNREGQFDNVLGFRMAAKSRKELEEFIKSTRLPFIIKGVLSETDAEKCLEAGAGGIVVSHHHGIMDYAIPPLMLLPRLTKIIEGKAPIFIDCGFMSGMDVFKALALGATAVSVGRAIMKPLSESGADGVRDKVASMTKELAGIMARTGAGTLKDIDPSVIWMTR